ncbi:MAG: hypothetical protein RLZZ546_623, partial [Bacteroidota bacterium]
DDLINSEEIKKLIDLAPELQLESLKNLYDELCRYEQGLTHRPNMDYIIGLTIDRANERKKKLMEQLQLLHNKRQESVKASVKVSVEASVKASDEASVEKRKELVRNSWSEKIQNKDINKDLK